MADSKSLTLFILVVIFGSFLTIPASRAQLTTDYYKRSCPKALNIIKKVVRNAIKREPRIGASLLRLHFHDCFVNVRFNSLFIIYYDE